MRRSVARRRLFGLAAAAMLVLAVGTTAAVTAWRSARETSTLAESVVDRHVLSLAGSSLIQVASSDQHTVKPWFQGKLNFSPSVPDLSSAGFPLEGGRIDTMSGRTVAALVYKRRLHIINVFQWPSAGHARATDARTIRGFHERHWSDGGVSLWAVSDVSAGDLDSFVQAFRSAANRP
jgi:anti-sigma factor RsiW